MITITTLDGKYFFASFINLTEEKSGEVDESTLQLDDLHYIITASSSKTIFVSEADLLKVRTRIASLSNPGSDIDLTPYATNESVDTKIAAIPLSNKVDKVTGKCLSSEGFMSTHKTAITNINSTIDSKIVNKADKSAVDLKADKTAVALKLDIPTEALPSTVVTPTVNTVPLYTIGNNGEYVLCTPDTRLLINGFYVPAYSASTVNPPA